MIFSRYTTHSLPLKFYTPPRPDEGRAARPTDCGRPPLLDGRLLRPADCGRVKPEDNP